MCGCLILLELLILSIDFAHDAVYSPTHSREQRDTFPVVTRATDIPVLRFPADLSVIQAQVQSHLILLAVQQEIPNANKGHRTLTSEVVVV